MENNTAIASPLWVNAKFPEENDPGFVKNFVRSQDLLIFRPQPEQIQFWDEAPNQYTYASLGSNGTTATVSAFGEIVQFDTFLGEGHSGMFSADHALVDKPLWADERTAALLELSKTLAEAPGDGPERYGLRFTNLTFNYSPKQTWINYRWPRYEWTDASPEGQAATKTSTIQWIVRDNIVIQHCTVTNLSETEMPLEFEFKGISGNEISIRDLDHVDTDYSFNELHTNYAPYKGMHGYSWVLSHKLTSGKSNIVHRGPETAETTESHMQKPESAEMGSVAVVVSVFLNGKALQWGQPEQWKIMLEGIKDTVKDQGDTKLHPNMAEVVIAYKMIYVPPEKASWEDFLIPASYSNISHFINSERSPTLLLSEAHLGDAKNAPQNTSGSQDDAIDQKKHMKTTLPQPGPILTHMNSKTTTLGNPSAIPARDDTPRFHVEYILQRNLEHILSVCSIPLKAPSMHSTKTVGAAPVPVALTCGPVSFHRVTASSSYFALQFLLDIAQWLKQPKCRGNEYGDWLLKRIETVCKGHLLWIADKAKKSESGLFVANYWVTGKILDDSSAWRPSDSLTDNPFQIIKAKNHADIFPEDRDKASAAIRCILIDWLSSLEKQDKRNSFAWPHAQESDYNIFRLDDHVWIWKALKAIDNLGLWKDAGHDQRMSNNVIFGETSTQKELRRLAKSFGYKSVQREILRRFTLVNDVSRNRTLATTRSPRDTRFLFHARDTVLFYEYEEFLLPETSFANVWANTIDAQKYHDENQETRWDNALRYALAIIMGTDGHMINKDKSPKRLIDESLRTLLKSSSQNGLFTGQLDETTGEPRLFYREEHRDFYFHATFEIPFVILRRATKIFQSYDSHYKDIYEKISEERSPDGTTDITEVRATKSRFPYTANQPNSVVQITQASHKAQEMKKSMPLNRFVDSSSIFDYLEEWLYNYPPFLSADKAPSFKELRDQVAGYVIDTRGSFAIEHLISENPDLAEEVIKADEEYRNKFIHILANYGSGLCINLFEEKDNRDLLKSFAESLKPIAESLKPITGPVVREFLKTGIVPGFREERQVGNTASNMSDPREKIQNFFQHDEIKNKLKIFLHAHTNILFKGVHKIDVLREAAAIIFGMNSDTIVRMLLRARRLFDRVKEMIEKEEGRQRQITLRAAVAYLESVYDAEESHSVHGSQWHFDRERTRVTVEDTEKKRTQGKGRNTNRGPAKVPVTNHELWTLFLHQPRTAKKAKKRYISLFLADPETALICVLGSPIIERSSMSDFFERHANYELYFFDDTTMSLNTWETEFHLSFFRLVSEEDNFSEDSGIPEAQYDTLPSGRRISKASMGFRFYGDFFDRYWTCHFIQFISPVDVWNFWGYGDQKAYENRASKQRKVLELVIFDSILHTLVSSTRDIFENIRENLGVPRGPLSFVNLDTDDYFSSSDRWQKLQHTLQALEDHLAHVIIYVGKWETREKDRGLERPRWTRNDESKYRGDMKKLLVSNNSKIKDLKSLQDEIKSLKVYLISRQDQIRNDLSLRGSENIRFFTYVTVVFLPLGFAASCFSMSDTPSGLLIGNMAGTAAVSLVLTVLALVNAERLGGVYNDIARAVHNQTSSRMDKSYLMKRYHTPRRQDHESVDGVKTAPTVSVDESSLTTSSNRSQQKSDEANSRRHRTDKTNWHLWFWMVYIFIELPVSRSAFAYTALNKEGGVFKLTPWEILNVLVGVLILPWCLICWLLQLVVLNAIDLLRLGQYFLGRTAKKKSPVNGLVDGKVDLLLGPDDSMRPFLETEGKLRKEDEKKAAEQRKASQKAAEQERKVEEEKNSKLSEMNNNQV